MVRKKRTFVLFLILVVAVLPAFARGASEGSSDPGESEPTETAAAQPDSGGASDASGASPAEPDSLDPATAELLFGLGVLPFEKRIPSQNFELVTLGGETASLEGYQGKVVFLNFWATWCGPCRDEMPSMQILYDTLADEGLEIVAVNVLEPEETVREFVDEFGFTYPVLMDRNGRVSIQYSVQAYPTTYIVDRDGNVIGMRRGTIDWSTPQMIDGFRELLAL